MKSRFFIKSCTYHNLCTGDIVKKLFVQTPFGSALIPYRWKKVKYSKKDSSDHSIWLGI